MLDLPSFLLNRANSPTLVRALPTRCTLTLLFASMAIQAGCGGGGSGNVTAPPPGGTAQVDSLVLSLDSTDVILGDTLRVSAEARDANGQPVPGIQLTYTSSDPSVATVTGDGLVTAVGLGEADIDVGIAGEAASAAAAAGAMSFSEFGGSHHRRFKVIVVVAIQISPGEQSLDPGATSQYQAVATDSKGNPIPNQSQPAWSSSNASVAGIDASGLVTANAEGDTDISATIVVGGHGYTKSVPLHVGGFCGGISQVPTWYGVVKVVYKAHGTAQGPLVFDVDQTSYGRADLTKAPVQSGDSVIWEGKVTGSVTMNNSETFPGVNGKNGHTNEVKNGPMIDGPAAVARLIVKKPSAAGQACTYTIIYSDQASWQVTNDQGAPPIPVTGSLGRAILTGQQVPPFQDSQQGRFWSLSGEMAALPTTLLGLTPPGKSGYEVGSYVGVTMVQTLGGGAHTFGQANFDWGIVNQ
jgi:hypothetical protein